MQASETKLRQLIEGTKQYVVPLFQRPYSWTEKHWKTLWTDVVEQSQHDDGRPHFFGSIVTAPARSVPQGVGKFLLIDGQQRITTSQVLLAAIRDRAARLGDERLRRRIDGQYLTNEYEEGDERLKVLPTNEDRAAFGAIIRQESPPPGQLAACHQFFSAKLDRLEQGRLEAIHSAIVDRFSLVSITCDEHDNPHLIFESLNAKGEKLTPADLIRNFLLMRVHVADQGKLFHAYWLPIQEALGKDLTEFVRHYLMKEGRILKASDVYFELKDRLANSTPAEAEAFLRDMHRHGLFYARFVDATREPLREIAVRLDRIKRLKVTVAYPFLLRVFDSYESGSLDKTSLIQTLDLLESFVIRRSIANYPTNQLRRMFPPAFDAAGGAGPSFLEGLRTQLGGSRCPDDETFASALASEPLYLSGEKNVRARIILERLEQSFNHKEPARAEQEQIEHVMPQTLTPQWESELNDEPIENSLRLMHTLGNLTLTGYNPELSNKPYALKRAEFANSHYELNRYFAEVDRWNSASIRERGQALAQRALTIWSDVGRPIASDSAKRPSQPPSKIRFRGIEQSVSNWKDAFVKLLTQFEVACPGLLQKISSNGSMLGTLAAEEGRFRRSKMRVGGVFVNTHASAAQLQEWCRRIADFGGIRPDDYEFVLSEAPA